MLWLLFKNYLWLLFFLTVFSDKDIVNKLVVFVSLYRNIIYNLNQGLSNFLLDASLVIKFNFNSTLNKFIEH